MSNTNFSTMNNLPDTNINTAATASEAQTHDSAQRIDGDTSRARTRPSSAVSTRIVGRPRRTSGASDPRQLQRQRRQRRWAPGGQTRSSRAPSVGASGASPVQRQRWNSQGSGQRQLCQASEANEFELCGEDANFTIRFESPNYDGPNQTFADVFFIDPYSVFFLLWAADAKQCCRPVAPQGERRPDSQRGCGGPRQYRRRHPRLGVFRA